MKYKKILTWACTAALFLTGCTTDTANNGRWMEDSNAVRIQASAGSTLTRSNPIATDEKQTGFNQGDKISVRNRNITVNYTFDGEKLWVPENDKYLVWDEKDLKFEAYYPYDGKNTFSVGYIKKNQSTPEALAESDYMNITSNLQSIPSDKRLPLELKRQTARLILKIQHFNDEFSKGVKVNKLDIGCPENTNGDGSWAPITPYQQNGDGGVGTTYTALVIPGKRTVYITPPNTNPDEPGIEDLKVETGELEAGKSYTYNLIVGKNKVTVGGVTVAEWTPGTPLQGGVAEEEDLTPYVTMTAASKQTFVMKCAGNYTLPDLEYSVNNNETWQKVVKDQGVDFGGDLGSLRLRGICPDGTATDYKNYSKITFSKENVKVDCSGDIRMLINYTAHETVATANCSFISLFQNCTALKSAPQLPAKALKESCYQQMFEGCTSLTQAPVLPATELKERCYQSMFKGCIALTQAPVLQATALKGQCYRQMFEGCTSLEQAPVLPATELQESCYFSMFSGCTALTQAPVLPATELKNYCYYSMFSGCTSLAQAPMLSAKELGWYCYNNMFKGCKSLVKAPALPATTLQPSCYSYMFANCEKLTEAPVLKAMKMESNSYKNMFEGCKSLVNAPDLPATTLNINCYQSMFSGCTSLKKAPELRAKKFEERCYCWMFQDCKKLESVTMLTNENYDSSLFNWLKGAGTEATKRTLKVDSKDFYNSTIVKNNPEEWKIGANCTVLDKDGKVITE